MHADVNDLVCFIWILIGAQTQQRIGGLVENKQTD